MPAPEDAERPATTGPGAHTTMASVEIEAEPAVVTALVTDAARISQWAPGFADAVHIEEDGAVGSVAPGHTRG